MKRKERTSLLPPFFVSFDDISPCRAKRSISGITC